MKSIRLVDNDTESNVEIINDLALQEVIEGLNQPQKQLNAKYLYDTTGSILFEQICKLEEYYPYRTELSMLPAIANDISKILQSDRDVVEFGAGSLVKIRFLLKHISQIKRFFPIDIAGDHLRQSAIDLQQEFPQLRIKPIEADFTQTVALPDQDQVKKLGFFPGSTIGNLTPELAIDFLKWARRSLGRDALLLIGVDTKKSPELLHRAYNDRHGITKKFNRNILKHINAKTGANFNQEKFYHHAFYNPALGRVEMHLISQEEQTVTIGEYSIKLCEGESIHTENSHKYTTCEFLSLAALAGWYGMRTWIADQQLFSVHLLRVYE